LSSTKEKHQPCEICGSVSDEYLYPIYDYESGVVKNVCLHHAKEDAEFKRLKESSGG
jgi:hypothetical protein